MTDRATLREVIVYAKAMANYYRAKPKKQPRHMTYESLMAEARRNLAEALATRKETGS
jgi:hypothetical protein